MTVSSACTVFDLASWSSKPELEGIEDQVVLAKHSLNNLLGPVAQRPKGKFNIFLENPEGKELSAEQKEQAHEQSKQLMRRVLFNTIDQYQLQETQAALSIQGLLSKLGQSDFKLTAREAADMIRVAGEATHTAIAQRIGPSATPPDGARMPTEGMVHLAVAVDEALRSGEFERHQPVLQPIADAILLRFLQHRLSFGETKAFLTESEQVFADAGLDKLAALCADIGKATPAPGSEDQIPARLHDNLYGRAFESWLVAELFGAPPAGVKENMRLLTDKLADVFEQFPDSWKEVVARTIREELEDDPRPWLTQLPTLQKFLNAASLGEAVHALRTFLAEPPETGAACIAIPWFAVKFSVGLKSTKFVRGWMVPADQNYRTKLGRAAARLVDLSRQNRRPLPTAGITLRHQPSVVHESWMSSAPHPADSVRPNLEKPSGEVMRALRQGIPYVTGASGSMNVLLHIMQELISDGAAVDPKSFLLGAVMFFTYDGGHSLHEALWVANQLDKPLKLGLGMPGGPAEEFVADYKQFIDLFEPGEGGAQLEAAVAKAWQETLDHFREHSYFATSDSATDSAVQPK